MRGGEGLPADLAARLNGHRPHTFTAAELMAQELPPVKWAVPELVPEGLTLLCGKPKLGKSWFALGLAVAIAAGGVALGTRRVERGQALYLALEDNKRRLQGRLQQVLAGEGAPEGLDIALAWPRLDEGGLEVLDRWLAAHPDARLIVVDTLAKIRPRAKGQHLYMEDYAAVEGLQSLAAEHGVAVVVVHHLRKLAAGDVLDEVSGSTGLSGGADGVLILKRQRGRADAYLTVTGREIEQESELALRWDANVAGWTVAGDAEEYRMSEERREIVGVLEETGEPMTPTEVAGVLGKSANSVKYLMWQMSKDGQLHSERGRYALTANPANSLTDEGASVSTVSTVSDDSGHGPNCLCEECLPV